MKTKNNFFKKPILLILVALILASNLSPAFALPDTIHIDCLDDLINFSENATLDTYFKGRTVILRGDIDVSELDNFSIPIFSGTFDGQGHTISGLNINKKGSIQGLFRYLEEGATIKNLNVSGNIIPSGSKDIVGGIVGKNMGTIENSSFKGTIMGESNIGGIAGINEATGSISRCSSEATISGEHYTGGIVGQNLGTILKSTNLSEVNNTVAELNSNIDDIDWSKINSMENVKAQTDTGGIAGYSSGYLQDCINRGPVGYKQFGYNVGGIAGRQTGYISNCQNYNIVKGRKDIGGIVGQLEPHLVLLYSEDTLQKLDKKLDTLNGLLDKSFTNSRNSSTGISDQIDKMIESVEDTKDSMEVVSRMSLDHIDAVEDTVNLTTERVRYTIDEIVPILDGSTVVTDKMSSGLDDIEVGFNNLEATSEELSNAISAGNDATDGLRDAMYAGDRAMRNLRDTVDYIKRINPGEDMVRNFENPPQKAMDSLSALSRSYEDKSRILSDFTGALENIDLGGGSNYTFGIIEKIKSIIATFKNLINNIDDIARVLSKIENILDSGLAHQIDPELYELQNLFKNLNLGVRDISYALSHLENASDESGKAFSDFSDGFSEFESASDSMADTLEELENLFDSLSNKPDIELPNISSEFRESGDKLFDNMQSISTDAKEVNSKVKGGSDLLIRDLENISDQVHSIFDLLSNSREDINLSETTEDISDENIEGKELGAIYKNQNYGSVEGVTNIGGAAGNMAIEYDFDPEGDIVEKGKQSLNFKYTSSAILKKCINRGEVKAKKDYVGGIAGRMDLGIISGSENYGNIESEEGGYVGGIAGVSYTKINKSYALSSLSGKNYIGGIAGYGTDLSNSYTLVELSNGDEWAGSIAGKVEGDISGNYYVENSLAAIDGISYSKKAAPISYEELLKVDSLPDDFKEFHITFLVDGEILEEVAFEYGDSFDLKNLPKIPEKEGHESSWEEFESNSMQFNKVVEAIYTPLKATLSANISRSEDDLPLALAEGQFREGVDLNITPFDIEGNDLSNSEYEMLEAWNISLDGLEKDSGSYKIRLLPPQTDKKLSIWQLKEGSWQKIDSKTNGSYLVFHTDGSKGTFAIAEQKFNWMIAIVAFSIAFLGFFAIKNSDRRK